MKKYTYNEINYEVEINYKKKAEKGAKMWRLNNTLLNKQWITEEIKEEKRKAPPHPLKKKEEIKKRKSEG